MADIVGTVIGAVACVTQCLFPSVERRFNRLRHFKSNFEKLKTKVHELKVKSRSIQRKVDTAKRNGDEIEEDVQMWLEKEKDIQEKFQKLTERARKFIGDDQAVEKMRKDEEIAAATGGIREGEGTTAAVAETSEDEEQEEAAAGEIREGAASAAAEEIGGDVETKAVVGEIREDAETVAAKKRCFKGLCPNMKAQYELSKEVEKMQQAVVEHLEAGEFDKISNPVIPKDPRLLNKDYEAFESRASTLANVTKSLSDPGVNIVGIYGMGGIGKTTLANEVAKQTKAVKVFDSVILVEVTDKPVIINIQKQIAENLGLSLSQDETEPRRAGRLCQRLKNEKKILVILDNIWADLDLKAIGIPLGDGCKVLLTARSVDVLSGKMNSQRNFEVALVEEKEAWRLFKKMSRVNIEGSEFESVARKVVRKCARLPIVIVTVARALRNKELFAWKDALQKWNIQSIHASLELSFNYLETEDLKKTFLLVRYANIKSIDELLLYGMSLGLFKDINRMEERRVRALTLVQDLKDSCLLLDGNSPYEEISMHDVVREVAMSIESKDKIVFTNENHAFTNEPFDELEWPDVDTLKDYPSVVLNDVKTDDLPEVLECPQLKLLAISGKDLKIHDEFFTRLTKLKVLVLANMSLSSLPLSLRLLINLQALDLYGCEVDDMAIVGDLKKLEILSLKGSYVGRLPVELSHLSRLKSFYVGSLCSKVIPPKVISSFSGLEELYILDADIDWDMEELKYLSELSCLKIKIKDAKTLPRDLCLKKLERYEIEIGIPMYWRPETGGWVHDFVWTKSCRKFVICLENTSICLKNGHIMQLKGIEYLWVDGLQDMNNVLYGLDKDGFPKLKYLVVKNNSNLLCFVDLMEVRDNAFPILETLEIINLINLEKICSGQLPTESLSQLRRINVEKCGKLENIFSFSTAGRLQLLQSIDVNLCKNMKEIFVIGRKDESINNSEVIDQIEFSQLRSLRLRSLPQLRSFCSKLKIPGTVQQRGDEIVLEDDNNVSNTFFNEKVFLQNLEILDLIEINVEMIWPSRAAAISSAPRNLTRLIIRGCNNLRCIFSSSIATSFIQLQHFEISNCWSLEDIINIDERKYEVFPQLQYLRMEGLGNLTKFCSGDSIEFRSLKELNIENCPKLKEFVMQSISANSRQIPLPLFNEKVVLPNLEDLNLFTINVESIWSTNLPKIFSFQKLNRVRIDRCKRLKNVFPMSFVSSLSQLETLDIRYSGVEEIVFISDEGAETNHRFVFPRLKYLKLRNLQNLKTFCSGRYTMECPTIKKLKVSGHEIEKIFYKQPQLLVENVFPNLEELFVAGKGIAMIRQFPEDLSCKLKYFHIRFNESTAISSLDFLQRFHSIKAFQINGLYSTELIEEVENGTSASISYLNWCSDLKHILKEESNMDHLVHLQIYECYHLVNLLPSLASFRNLITLEVYDCQGLTDIVTYSTAKSLGQLKELIIEGCQRITKVVAADEGDEAKDYEIVFSELKELHLIQLRSLTSFCSANYAVKFPSLEELIVGECHEMKSFSRGNLSTPKLQKVKHWRWKAEIEYYWKGDLNTTIQHLHEEKQMMCSDDEEENKEDNEEEDVSGNDGVYERRKGKEKVTNDEEDVSGSSNVKAKSSEEDPGQQTVQNLHEEMQMMCSDDEEVNKEDKDEEYGSGNDDVKIQSSKEDSGQTSMQHLE